MDYNFETFPDLIIYDFDGVMTDNTVLVNQNGEESVMVNRADGLAVSEIKKLGIKQIIISTEKNFVVSTRAKKLKIECFQNISNKENTIIELCQNLGISLKNVLFIGNDINDKTAMERVGIRMCPSDAHEQIKTISDFVFKKKGGCGVIRELLDYLTMSNVKNTF